MPVTEWGATYGSEWSTAVIVLDVEGSFEINGDLEINGVLSIATGGSVTVNGTPQITLTEAMDIAGTWTGDQEEIVYDVQGKVLTPVLLTFYDLTIKNDTGNGGIDFSNESVSVSNDFKMETANGVTLTIDVDQMTVGNDVSVVKGSNSTIELTADSMTVTGDCNLSVTILSLRSLTLNAPVSQLLTTGGNSITDVHHTTSGTCTLADGIIIDGTLYQDDGTFSFASYTSSIGKLELGATGNPLITNNGTLTIQDDLDLTNLYGWLSTNGTLILDKSAGTGPLLLNMNNWNISSHIQIKSDCQLQSILYAVDFLLDGDLDRQSYGIYISGNATFISGSITYLGSIINISGDGKTINDQGLINIGDAKIGV